MHDDFSHVQTILCFDNDRSYIRWIADNPGGFVLNMRRRTDPSYVVLHRANCRSVSGDDKLPGAYTERQYRKIASLSIEALADAARAEGRKDGSFSKCCSKCRPLDFTE